MTREEWNHLHPTGRIAPRVTDPEQIYENYVKLCRTLGQEPANRDEWEQRG